MAPRWYDRPSGRRAIVAALLLLMAASAVALVLMWRREQGKQKESADDYAFIESDGGVPPKLWQLPAFTLRDQANRETTLASLRGQPFVADFIYTQCTSACPMLTARMVILQRLLAGAALRFVSFSVDPAHDTPEALAAYAARWNGGETRWSLLATTDASLASVSAGFKVGTEKTRDEKNPIVHSDSFFLVDAEGYVRGVYSSEDDGATARLVSDARALSRAPDAPPALDNYTSLGCGGCHDNPKLAPPLVNLAGAERMLADGTKVTIDDAYLRRAILEPSKQVVADYPPIMPSYWHYLRPAQVDALIAELDARKGDAGAPDDAATVIDPVCGMQVRAVPDAPHVTWQGEDVYFCSEMDREAFEKDPGRYAPHD